jgi:hypothetical protein
MVRNRILLAVFITASYLFFCAVQTFPRLNADDQSPPQQSKSDPADRTDPPYRTLSHGVHPGSADGVESRVADIALYERAVGQEVAFVYFTQELNKNWLERKDEGTDPLFPEAQVEEIRRHGAIPFIRLMVRSRDKKNEDKNHEKLYSYSVLLGEAGLKGDELKHSQQFQERMAAWGAAAAKYDFPIYVEWGTEVNGKWFWWNGKWYAERECEKNRRSRESKGACLERVLPQAPRKFQEVFRHMRRLVNVEGKAANVRWIFHVTASSDPEPQANGENAWNGMAKYYPEGAVDAVGVSVYGAQTRSEPCAGDEYSFTTQMNQLTEGRNRPGAEGPVRPDEDTLKKIDKAIPIYILEFGETLLVAGSDNADSNCNAGKWAREALAAMFHPGNWADYNLAGFSWWNEAWVDDDDGITDMRVHDFQLCDPRDKGDKKVDGMRCDCWRVPGEGCENLSKKRADLREAFRKSLEDRRGYVITSAPESFGNKRLR